MNTTELKVSKVNALKAWRDTDKDGRLLLENLYGEKVFQNQDVRDRIKTFEDALAETGRPNVPDFSNAPEDMKDYFVAQYKMSVIAEALNEGWTPDWDNDDEEKWRPWFVMGAAFRFAIRATITRMPTLVAAPTFASEQKNYQPIVLNNSFLSGEIFN